MNTCPSCLDIIPEPNSGDVQDCPTCETDLLYVCEPWPGEWNGLRVEEGEYFIELSKILDTH